MLVPSSRAAFTLIELLTVMAIILVLAGLILGIAGNAQYKSAMARANTEISAMSTALDSYKADNGAYPRDPSNAAATDALNAQSTASADIDPGASPVASNKYAASCIILFEALSGIQPSGTTPTKAYMTFTPGQLSSGTSAPVGGTTYIIDPFGFCYGYSTANQAAQDAANASPTVPVPTPDPTKGYNPTLDLWSTGGYATGGKSYPSGVTSATYYTLWAKNW